MIVVEKVATHWLVNPKGTSRRVFVVRGDAVTVEHWDKGYCTTNERMARAKARARYQWLVKQGWQRW